MERRRRRRVINDMLYGVLGTLFGVAFFIIGANTGSLLGALVGVTLIAMGLLLIRMTIKGVYDGGRGTKHD